MALLGQLPNRVIERADLDIQIALDHRRLQAALDLVGVHILAMEHAQNQQFGFHSLIILV